MGALLAALAPKAAGPAALLLLSAAERLRPASPAPERARGLRRPARNLSLGGVNALLSLALVAPLTAGAAAAAPDWRPGWALSPWFAAVDLLLLDLWIWAWHRANHEVPLLWRFHEVHHLDETLDATTALRFHLGEVALSALARAPFVYALAVPFKTVVVFEALVLLASLFHHSNLRLPPRLEAAASKVVVTPSIHWVHHHAVRADTDSRYGTVLSVWDRLFGTTTPARRAPGMPIGVEGPGGRALSDRPLPALLARPLRRRAPRAPRVPGAKPG